MRTKKLKSSLRDFDRVEDRIRQHRQAIHDAVLIVEGPSDYYLLKEFFAAENIFPAQGKKNVIDAVSVLNSWGITGIRGLVDRDFEDPPKINSIITYDFRDLEGAIVNLGGLKTIVEAFGSASKIENAGGINSVVDTILTAVKPLTFLRAINHREQHHLKFDAVDIQGKIDRTSLELKTTSYATALNAVSDSNLGSDKIEWYLNNSQELDDLGPRGRDVLSWTGVALRKRVGTLSQAESRVQNLENALKISSIHIFRKSLCLQKISDELSRAFDEIRGDSQEISRI